MALTLMLKYVQAYHQLQIQQMEAHFTIMHSDEHISCTDGHNYTRGTENRLYTVIILSSHSSVAH